MWHDSLKTHSATFKEMGGPGQIPHRFPPFFLCENAGDNEDDHRIRPLEQYRYNRFHYNNIV